MSKEKNKLKIKKNYTIYVLIGIMLIVGVVAINNYNNIPNSQNNTELTDVAQCLTNKGVIMAGTSWCSHCNTQKEMFGQAFELVNFIDCDENSQECQKLGVEGYPTWIFEDETYPGVRQINQLKEITNC